MEPPGGINRHHGFVRATDYLNTTDPRNKSIRNCGENDRIAVTAVKVTHHAIILQMAAVQTFG